MLLGLPEIVGGLAWLEPSEQGGLHVARETGYTLDHTWTTITPVNSELPWLSDSRSGVRGDPQDNRSATFQQRCGGQQFDHGTELMNANKNNPGELPNCRGSVCGDGLGIEVGDAPQFLMSKATGTRKKVLQASCSCRFSFGDIFLIRAPLRCP